TSTTRSTYFLASGNMSSPTRRGASESAAMPPAGASTGFPASSARASVGAASGSTATIRIELPYHAAIPPISPPPPTATRSVSRSAACCCHSSPSVPYPRRAHASPRHLSREQVGKRAARLERAGVLQELGLEVERTDRQAEVLGVDVATRRAAHVRPDQPLYTRYLFASEVHCVSI